MKIVFWFVALLLIQLELKSQTIFNSNFEQWEFIDGIEEPTYWKTNNELNHISVSKDSTQTGDYSMKVTGNAPGFEGPYPGTAQMLLEYDSIFLIRGISTLVKYEINQIGQGGIAISAYKDGEIIGKNLWGYFGKDTIVDWHTIQIEFPERISTQEVDSLSIFLFASGFDEGFGFRGNSELTIDNVEFIPEIISSINNTNDNSLTISPNPFDSYVKIHSNGFEIKTIEIYDSFGRKILETTNDICDLSNLINGTYFIRVTTKKGKLYLKKIQKSQ